MRRASFVFLLHTVFVLLLNATALQAAEKLNVLLITVDDMSCDSIGVFGCKLADTSPNVDRLAKESLRFAHAHVQVGNCMPSRNVMGSGLYPHNNRVEGFYQIREPGYPVLADLMKQAGYFTSIRHKVSHWTPYSPYPAWDLVLGVTERGQDKDTKNVASYYESAKDGIANAKKAGKPFYMNINIADPHKPFFNEGKKPDPNQPTRVFTADEVPVPGFLFDDPQVREELARYYSSVRRADDCVGQVLRALDESGQRERTLIVFLSDHGMPLPFAKTQLYYHSTHTPLIVNWPGVTKAGAVDEQHMVSSVDLLPTLLDIVGIDHPKRLDGLSYEPLLRGEKQKDRDYVVTEYNENSGGIRDPMRAIVTKDFSYIFNPWSDGERSMATATKGTTTYRRMQALAKSDKAIAARLDLFDHRVPEEMYNYAVDPDARENLIDRSEYRAERDKLVALLEAWMVKTGDPMLEVFRHRTDPAAREAYMKTVEGEAADRKATGVKKTKAKKGAKKGGKKTRAAKDSD